MKYANPVSPKTTPWSHFVGQRVAVAFNLAVCAKEETYTPGDGCWTVRAKPTNASPVLGYCPSILLHDCVFVVNRGLLERKRLQGKRDVFAFVVGTAVALSTKKPTQWLAIGYRPMPKRLGGLNEDAFVIRTGPNLATRTPVQNIEWFFGDGRKGVGSNGAVKNPAVPSGTLRDLRELAADVPSFYDVE